MLSCFFHWLYLFLSFHLCSYSPSPFTIGPPDVLWLSFLLTSTCHALTPDPLICHTHSHTCFQFSQPVTLSSCQIGSHARSHHLGSCFFLHLPAGILLCNIPLKSVCCNRLPIYIYKSTCACWCCVCHLYFYINGLCDQVFISPCVCYWVFHCLFGGIHGSSGLV